MTSQPSVTTHREVPLVEVLDRVIDKGVVLEGDIALGVAEVDLVYLGLKLVLCSADRVGVPLYSNTAPPAKKQTPSTVSLATTASTTVKATPTAPATSTTEGATPTEPSAVATEPLTDTAAATSVFEAQNLENLTAQNASKGLAQLVLTLVELLRELMERQAVRRMERGTVNDQQVEDMGQTFMQINACMDELKRIFELTDADLNLDLGPLGRLLD